MNTETAHLEAPSLDTMPATASIPVSSEGAELLEQGLAADQAEREQRRAIWERRRDQLVTGVETGRRRMAHLIGFGGVLVVLVLVTLLLSLVAGPQFSLGAHLLTGMAPDPSSNLAGLLLLGIPAGGLLVGLFLRTLVSAVGEAVGRGLVRAAQREGVELAEVRFD